VVGNSTHMSGKSPLWARNMRGLVGLEARLLGFWVGMERTKEPNQPRLKTDQRWLDLIPLFQFD
jgi:hypothetical protein